MGLNLGEYDPDANLAKLNMGIYASLPEDMEYEQFRKRWLKNQKRGVGEAVWEWAKAVPEGLSEYFTEDVAKALNNKSMLRSMLGMGEDEGDARKAWSSLFAAGEVGLRDSYNTFKVLTSSVKDYFNSELTQDQRIDRDFARYKYEQNYFNDAREKVMASIAPEFRDDMSVLADFLDPTNLTPGLLGTKFLSKGTRKALKGTVGYGGYFSGKALQGVGTATEKVFGAPAKVAEKYKLKGMYRGAQGAAFTIGAGASGAFQTIGGVIATVGVGELLGKIARKTGKEIAEVSRVFSQPSSHARFLHRITTDENVSKPMRKLAARMYKMRGTKMYDVLFDSLVAGIGSGAAQVALEAAKGKSAEEVGYATGAGIAMGAPAGAIGGERGSGKSTADYDASGNYTERSQQSINDYLARKAEMMDRETIKAFTKLDSDSKLTLATLDELSGLGTVRMHLLDDEKFREKNELGAGASLPAAYDPGSKTIFLNESQLKEGTKVASWLFLHEYGHHFLSDMLGSNPLMSRKILESFEDPAGVEYFFKGEGGKNMGSIKVNKEAHAFAQKYAKDIRSSDEATADTLTEDRDAFLLAQEIGAEQFSMMMQDNPNAFAQHDKSFRHMLIGAAHDALSKIGVLDPRNGREAQSAISKAMLKNKDVRKTYDNFIKERTEHYRGRSDDIERGRKHAPRSGQTSDERFTQLFGGVGVNLQTAAQFYVKDQVMFDELMEALEIAANSDGDYAGLGKGAEGSKLHPKVREVFGKSGAYTGAVRAIIDMVQASIDNRVQLKFGYRSGSWKDRSQYNPFFERSVTAYGWQISPKKMRNYMGRTVYPNLKIVAYDTDQVMNNIEMLAHAGFIDKIDDFTKQFQQHAQDVLTPDGEGRINPEGLGENELFVAALGMKESFQFIQNPKLADWVSNPENKLKNSFRSYDVGQLAGLATQNKPGFAFDYHNAKRNYMPALAGQGYRDSTIKPKRGSRVPELVEMAGDLGAGKLTPEQYKAGVDKYKPVDTLTEEDIIPATVSEMKKALHKSKSFQDAVGKGKDIPAGTKVGLRLDINAYLNEKFSAWVPTIHEGWSQGKKLAHEAVAVINNAFFKNHKDISHRIASGKINKTSFARINGEWSPSSVEDAVKLAKEALANKDGSWTQVGFDPERHSYFYDRMNHGIAVTKADQVVQVGRAVFAKNAVKQHPEDAFGPGAYFMPAKIYGMRDNISQDVLSRMPQEKFSPEQLLAKIREVKGAKEMMEDTKLDQFIKGRKSLTKDEVYNHLAANYPKLEVIDSRGGEPMYEEYKLEGGEQYEEHITVLNDENYPREFTNGHWDSENAIWHFRKTKRAVEDGRSVYFLEEVQSDWHQAGRDEGYLTPEQTDMLEERRALRAKKEKLEGEAFAFKAEEVFKDLKTYDNVKRVIERFPTIAASFDEAIGKARRVKEALQSGEADFNSAEAGQELWNDAVNMRRMLANTVGTVVDGDDGALRQAIAANVNNLRERAITDYIRENWTKAEDDRIFELENWFDNGGISKVPDAPFKKSWHAMALKQAISNAIRENRKFIGWTTGDNAANLFRLDKFYNDVVVERLRNPDGSVSDKYNLSLWRSGKKSDGDGSDKDVYNRSAKGIELWIGKEAARKAIEQLDKDPNGEVNITNLDLKNQGMRNFYDRDMVEAAKQIAKHLGVRPPIKSKVSGQNVLATRTATHSAWVMELPKAKSNHDEIISRMPLYMPDINPTGDGGKPLVTKMGMKGIYFMPNLRKESGWLFPNGMFIPAPYSDHEKVLAYYMDGVPDDDKFKSKVMSSKERTMTLKGLDAGLMRVKKDGTKIYFQGKMTPAMRGIIEKSGIEHEFTAIHDKTSRGSRENTEVIYSPPGRQFMPRGKRSPFKAAVGVAPKRTSVVPTLEYGSKIAKQPEFEDFVKNNIEIAETLGFEIVDQRPVVGGWKDSETNAISREASHRLLIKSDSDADLNTFAAITGALADEVQDSVMQVRYIKRNTKDSSGREYHINIDPKLGEQITSLRFLEKFGLEGGFTYDPKDEKLIFATWSPEEWAKVFKLIKAVDNIGGLRGVNEASATVSFPEIKDYRSLLSPARIERYYGGTDRAAVRDLAQQARAKLESHERNKALFMPATATERMAEKKSRTRFETITYINTVDPKDKLPINSQRWSDTDWENYFEDQKLADALMQQFKGNATPESWSNVNEVRTGRVESAEMPAPPTQLLEWVNDPVKLAEFIEQARIKNPKLVQLAEQGVLASKKNYGAKKTPEVVAQSFIWGFLSRMLDPYNQEAGWIRTTSNQKFWDAIYQSIDGSFNMPRGEYMTAEKIAVIDRKWKDQAGYKKLLDRKDQLAKDLEAERKEAEGKAAKKRVTEKFKKKRDKLNAQLKDYIDSRYKKLSAKQKLQHKQDAANYNLTQQPGTWIELVSNMFAGQDAANANAAGQNARQNINEAHSLLTKWNGRWNEVTDIFNSSMSGQQMREQMWKMGLEGGGIGDKVTSFVIATMADGGVVIMDRWQFVNCWLNEIRDAVAKRGREVEAIMKDEKASAQAKAQAKKLAKEYAKYGDNPFRYSANDVPEDRSNFYEAVGSQLSPVAEHALYRTMEFYFQQMADGLQQLDPNLYGWIDSPFAVHWLLWNIAKDEAVGHSSLDILSDIIQNNTAPQNPGQRQQFVQNYQTQQSFAEKNEFIPKENIQRRSRFRIKQGKPEEEVQETRRFKAFGQPSTLVNTYFR